MERRVAQEWPTDTRYRVLLGGVRGDAQYLNFLSIDIPNMRIPSLITTSACGFAAFLASASAQNRCHFSETAHSDPCCPRRNFREYYATRRGGSVRVES